MPNRIIREGIISSEPVNSLGWAEEVFYRRLLSVVDDFGRFHGNPSLLRAACYPLQVDKVGNQDIAKWLTKCVGAGLVKAYTVDGKDYVEVEKFGQQVRAKASKYPQPPSTCAADATQVPSKRVADAHLDGFEDGGGNASSLRDSATTPVLSLVPEEQNQNTPLVTRANTPKATRFKVESLSLDERTEWFEFCKRERPDLNAIKTRESFADFWKAKAGRDGAKLDWFATWRNWVRNQRTGRSGAGLQDGAAEYLRQQEKEISGERLG